MIYLCEHMSWAKYITSERESLELLETTEYIQKSREIAGEQTLYKYHEIPWFVIPFTTVYRYTFSGSVAATGATGATATAAIGDGVALIKVSSVNFALFYAFVNECARDFRYCIFHELTQLQSLVQSGVYSIYMLLLHQVRVLAVYIFAPSWMKVSPAHTSVTTSTANSKLKRTRGNRISSLHDHISRTSTALVKYLPPVTRPTYDAFGKRIKYTAANGDGGSDRHHDLDVPDILLLKSSIRHKTLCDHGVFVRGFVAAATTESTQTVVVSIDTIAHNYHIIDALMASSPSSSSSFTCISQDKWYYILYNAIIHEETVCKDILMV